MARLATAQQTATAVRQLMAFAAHPVTVTTSCAGASAVVHADTPAAATRARRDATLAGWLTADSYGPEAFAVLAQLLPGRR